MKKWKIPVTWTVCGLAKVEADTLEEAMKKVEYDSDNIPLPADSTYVDGSFESSYPIDDDNIELIRTLHNNNQQDD